MNKQRLTTCQQPREYVGCKRCPDLLGVKGPQAAWQVLGEISRLNRERSQKTARLEAVRGMQNSRCSGGMRRYREEYQRRRRHPGTDLTLRGESVGSEPD